MLFFTIRRIIASALVLLVSSFLVFALCAASFDPLAKYYAQATRRRRRPSSRTSAHVLGLDKPFFLRLLRAGWAVSCTVDFGNDINGQSVSDQLWPRLAVTGRLIIAAIIIAVILAIIVGVTRRGAAVQAVGLRA